MIADAFTVYASCVVLLPQ